LSKFVCVFAGEAAVHLLDNHKNVRIHSEGCQTQLILQTKAVLQDSLVTETAESCGSLLYLVPRNVKDAVCSRYFHGKFFLTISF
jgi:hypothetical protein